MADARRRERARDKLNKVPEGEPCQHHPTIDRLRKAGADPDANCLQPVLVPVQSSEILSEGLRQSIERVGTLGHRRVDDIELLIKTDRVDRAREDDPLHTGLPGCFVEVVGSVDVHPGNAVVVGLERDPAKVDDRVDILDEARGG